MNIKEYIESGLLELYVMDSLSESERKELEIKLREHPELAAEVKAIEESMESFAMAQGMEPSDKVRSSIMEKIEVLAREERIASNVPAVKSPGRILLYAAAAMIALLIGSNFIFWNKWKKASSEISSLNQEKDVLASQFNTMNTSYQEMLSANRILTDDSYKIITMNGLALAPEAKVKVMWNPVTNESFVDIINMPPPPPGKQYQLWAIVDGKPVDAGMFNLVFEGMQKMKNIQNAQAFAVTLEPMGGSPSPTMSAMFVMGKV